MLNAVGGEVSVMRNRVHNGLALVAVVGMMCALVSVVLPTKPAWADSAPVLNSATYVDSGVSLSYTDASVSAGSTIESYAWQESVDGGATVSYGPALVEPEGSPFIATNATMGCQPDETCSFQVGALIESSGGSLSYFWSDWVQAASLAAPVLSSAMLVNAGLSLSYVAPSLAAGQSVSGWEWQSSLDGGTTVYYSADADLGPSPLIIPKPDATLGCPQGRTCSFQIRASEGDWLTPWSNWATGRCTTPYEQPASWDTARVTSTVPGLADYIEPINVIISACSTVSLSDIQAALGNWDTVYPEASITFHTFHVRCISPENANVTGSGYVTEDVAWRLGGCVGGNIRSLLGFENHVRIWNQPAEGGSSAGAWFITASFETACVGVDSDLFALKTVDPTKAMKFWHCVDGGPGSFGSNGYDHGAEAFADDVVTAAQDKGWIVTKEEITRPITGGDDIGEDGVKFNGAVYVLTVTK